MVAIYFCVGFIVAIIELWREARISKKFPWLEVLVAFFVPPFVIIDWVRDLYEFASRDLKNPFYNIRHREKK